MSIQRWSQDVILVNLPEELGRQDELQTVIAMLREDGACDVVVDFSQVQVVGGAWLTRLQKIQRLANEGGHRLTLCGVPPAIRGVFTIARLNDLFQFAEDRFTALARPQMFARPAEFPLAGTSVVPARILTVAGDARPQPRTAGRPLASCQSASGT